jgi:uncharacterized protein
MTNTLIVLSHYQIKPVLKAYHAAERTSRMSLDLNLTQSEVDLSDRGVHLPDGTIIPWPEAERIAESENTCFHVTKGGINPIQAFSEVTGWARSLYPTVNAPTMLVAGLTMHRISRGVDPYEDTQNKIRAAAPLTGNVLDTATGLGYTAIQAAKTAAHVTTIELDPEAIEICRLNPWSQPLFDNSKIEQIIGDSWDVVEAMADAQFSCVLHDPPAFNLAGDMYAADFYGELYRVMTRKGRLFHYIGDPESKSGATVTRGVIKRLQEVGFRRIDKKPRAFGVVAYK